MPSPHFALEQIVIDGLDGDARATAEREVRNLFQLAGLSGVPCQRVGISVHLADDLEGTIDRFNAQHGIEAEPYDRTRPQGISCGKALAAPGDSDTFSYMIFLDAALWSEHTPEHVVYRAYGLARLLGHIVIEHRAGRAMPIPPTPPGKYMTDLWHRASSLCHVWDLNMTAFNMCNACLKDQDGNPVSLTHYFGNQSILMVSEFLDQLCIFASFDVQFYRATAIGLDDLPPTALFLSEGLLASVVEAASLFASCEQFELFRDAVSRMNGFREFLEPIWTDIMDGCIAEEGDARQRAFTSAVVSLFDRLGLVIEDMENDGLYVHVHDPVMCSWTESDDIST